MTIQQAVKAVLPHASKDKMIPVLCAVQLQGDRVIATDRYTLAESLYEPGDGEVWHALEDGVVISAADAKTLAAVKGVITGVDMGSDTVEFTHTEGVLTVRIVDGDYPAVQRLMHSAYGDRAARVAEIVPVLGIGLDHLAKLKPVALKRGKRDNNGPLVWSAPTGPGKCVLARYSDHTTIMIMPVRNAGEAYSDIDGAL